MNRPNSKRLFQLGLFLIGIVCVGLAIQMILSFVSLPSSTTLRSSTIGISQSAAIDSQAPMNPQSPIVLPTPAGASNLPQADGWLVTPSTNQKVRLGAVVELERAATKPPRYEAVNTMVTDTTHITYVLTITDTATGAQVRLGSDNGSAVLGINNDKYLVWTLFCDSCKEMIGGMYVYDLATGTQHFVTDKLAGSTYPKLDKDWAVYPYVPDPRPSSLGAWAQLYAYNIPTKETIHLTDELYWPHSGVRDRFAVGGDKIVWLTGPPTPEMHIYDLSARQELPVKLPIGIGIPLKLSVQEDVVIWWDEYWHGYDIDNSTYFAIPVVPPGWEKVRIENIDDIRVTDRQLSWGLQVDGKWHYFTAPLMSVVAAP